MLMKYVFSWMEICKEGYSNKILHITQWSVETESYYYNKTELLGCQSQNFIKPYIVILLVILVWRTDKQYYLSNN